VLCVVRLLGSLDVLQGCQGVYHYIYFKQHSSKQDSEGLPRKRTLFVLNPPLDAEHALASVFEEAGAVEAVRDTVMQVQQREHRPVKAAYVIFEQAAGLTKALGLDLTKKRSLPASSAEGESFGLRRWQQEYEAQRPDTKALQSKIDADMVSASGCANRRRPAGRRGSSWPWGGGVAAAGGGLKAGSSCWHAPAFSPNAGV